MRLILTVILTFALSTSLLAVKKPFTRIKEISGPNGSGSGPMAIADMDGDGDIDVVTDARGLAVFKNKKKGKKWSRVDLRPGRMSGIRSIQLVDMDNDKDLDVLVCSDRNDPGITWYENLGKAKAWKAHPVDRKTWHLGAAAAADLDGDGDKDLFAALGSKVVWLVNKHKKKTK